MLEHARASKSEQVLQFDKRDRRAAPSDASLAVASEYVVRRNVKQFDYLADVYRVSPFARPHDKR